MNELLKNILTVLLIIAVGIAGTVALMAFASAGAAGF